MYHTVDTLRRFVFFSIPIPVFFMLTMLVKQNHVKEFFESRSRAEDDAANPRTPRNRLHVSSLVALLEEHRDMTVFGGAGAGDGAVEARRLAEKYGVDVELFRRLVRSVNVPSVREDGAAAVAAGSVRHVRDAESGEDVPVKEVSACFLVDVLSGLDWFRMLMLLSRTGRVEGAKISQGRFIVCSCLKIFIQFLIA